MLQAFQSFHESAEGGGQFFEQGVLAVLDHDFRKQLQADGELGHLICIVKGVLLLQPLDDLEDFIVVFEVERQFLRCFLCAAARQLG